MRKRNLIFFTTLSILFVASIYLYFLNTTKIEDTKNNVESLKIQLESLKSENESLIKTNSDLNKKHTSSLEKVNGLKNILN